MAHFYQQQIFFLNLLETKQLPEKFENAKFKLTLDNDTFITTASLENFNENIYVYNTDFIK